MKKFLNWIKSPSSDFALFIILLILANLVSYKAFARFDLTGPKSYSISKQSKQIVKNIEEPLSVRVFFDNNLPSQYNNVYQYVKDLLVEYKGAANKNFSVTYMDLSKSENQKLAQQYGLQQVQIQEVKNNEVGFKQVYMGLVVSYGDNIEVINPITSADGFEYTLTSKISSMISASDALQSIKNEKIKVTFYLSDLLKTYSNSISGITQVENSVRNAVGELNTKNKDKIDFAVINPDESEISVLASKYGFPRINVQDKDGSKKSAVLGLVMEYGDKLSVIPLSLSRGFFGGYGISGLDELSDNLNVALQTVLSKTTKIGYITGHDELSHESQSNPYGMQTSLDAANFASLLSGMYELVDIDLNSADIPNGMSSIIINGPKSDFTEEELYKIDQFVMKGGNVLFFVDPLNEGQQDYYGNVSYTPNETNIERLLEKYGVKREYNYVFDKNCYTQSNQQYGKLNLYWAPLLQKNALAKKNPITSNLGYVIMLQNGALDVSEAEANKNLNTTVLAKSSEKSWTKDSNIILHPMYITVPEEDKMKSENLAVLVEGKFDSAFEKSVEASNNEEKGIENLSTDSHIAQGIQNSKIIVVSSSAVTTAQLIDTDASNPIAMFLLNCVDYLNGNEELCTMRTKGLSLNTLTIKSQGFALVMKYFNQFGLVVLVAVFGLIVLRQRSKRRKQIEKKYNN